MKKGICIIISIFFSMILFPVPTGAADSVQERQTVRVGFFAFEGYHMIDEQGRYSGYGYEILQHMAGYTNWKYEYIGYDKSWSEMQDMLENGEIDLLTSAQMTPERLRRFYFSDEAVGTSSAILTVKTGNTDYEQNDYEHWNGIRVGMIKGNSRNDRFAEYAEENGFTYQPVYYEYTEDMLKALETGEEIDAILTSNLRTINGEWILAQFDTSPFYVMVQKGNTKLLNQINYAIDQMDSNEPGIRTKLMHQYYKFSNGDEIAFTQEERDYIDSMRGETLTAVVNPDNFPFSYRENGEMKGIIYEIAEKIIQRSKLNIQFVEVNNFKEYTELVKSGNVDICFDANYDFVTAEQLGNRLTTPYLDVSVSKVFLKDQDTFSSVALLKDSVISQKNYDYFVQRYDSLTYYDTLEEVVKAVAVGRQDAAYLYRRTAGLVVQRDVKNQLTQEDVYGLETSFSTAVDADNDPRLYSVISKSVFSIEEEDISIIDDTYSNVKSEQFSLIGSIYDNPIAFMLIMVALFVIMIMLVAVLLMKRRRVRELAKLVEEERRNQLLTDALAAAEEANVAKNQFLSRISHELRTPLNAIIGFMELAKDADEEKVRDYLANSEIAAKQLLSIINDVLDMSSIEAGKLKIAQVPFDFKELIHSISSVYEIQCSAKGISFKTQYLTSVEEWLVGDQLRVNQILMNLLGNAIKFTERGTVSLLISQHAAAGQEIFIRFKVTDTGCGMSEDLKKRLFKPFEQENSKTAQKYGGSGLGLSIVKNLVHMMEGAISVESELDHGTTFVVDLPFTKVKDQADNSAATQYQRNDFEHKRVLIVEDNEMNRMVTEGLVSRLGIECECAEDGRIAVDKFNQSEEGYYDAILMDIQMPNMDGFEATKTIRGSNHPDAQKIQIIALTANAFNEDIAKTLSSGMNAHVAKPIEPEILEETLHEILRRDSYLEET